MLLFDRSPPTTFQGFNSAVTSPDDVADVHGDEELEMVQLIWGCIACWIRFCIEVPGASWPLFPTKTTHVCSSETRLEQTVTVTDSKNFAGHFVS